jgi:hypothetical protein
MDAPDFKTVLGSVRPARVALLLDEQDPDWQVMCQGAIQFFSQAWGGEYTLIVPTDGIAISPSFWKLLEAFDPDYIWTYSKTGLDFRRAHPERFSEEVEKELGSRNIGDDQNDRTRAQIEKALEKCHASRWGIRLELEKELKERLAPFHMEDRAIWHSAFAGESPSYPLTPVTTILPHCSHHDALTTARTSDNSVPQLWIDAATGSIPESLHTSLHALGISTGSVDFTSETLHELCQLVMIGKVNPLHRAVASAVWGANYPITPEQLKGTPFQFSLLGLSKYRSGPGHDWQAPVIVIVGSTVQDFCLYFNLSRIRQSVHWLPSEWADQFSKDHNSPQLAAFAEGLLESARAGQGRKIFFSTVSLTPKDLEETIDSLDASSHYTQSQIRSRRSVDHSLESLLANPLIVLNTDNFSIPTTLQTVDGRAVGFIPTPKPKGFTTIVVYKHRWITELDIEGNNYPRHPELGSWLVRDTRLDTDSVRSGAMGLAYECPNSAHFGGDVDTILIRPKLYLPDAAEIFEYLARAAGWTAKIPDSTT